MEGPGEGGTRGEGRQKAKGILNNEGERQNLLSIGLCTLLVLVITAVVFGLVSMKFDFSGEADPTAGRTTPVESSQ